MQAMTGDRFVVWLARIGAVSFALAATAALPLGAYVGVWMHEPLLGTLILVGGFGDSTISAGLASYAWGKLGASV